MRGLLGAREVTEVVNACDAGREGELIFRYVYELARCRKPVRRLWISSLTAEAIQRGMASLRPGAELDPLADAARSRAEADWAGRHERHPPRSPGWSSAAGGKTLMSVGRVQTPTLALIVRREQEIEKFKSEPYWQVRARFESAQGEYEGLWHRPAGRGPGRVGKGDAPSSAQAREQARERATRLTSREEAEAIVKDVLGTPGRVARVERKTIRERPPLLFDLTGLQKAANRRLGMSAKRTLAAAQALYERHKAITYPRTDSHYLTSDMASGLPDILAHLEQPPYRDLARAAIARGVPRGKRMINDSEVGDHHAIIPTAKTVDVSKLGPDEQKIHDLVARRFIAGFLPDAVFDKTEIETRAPIPGNEGQASEGRTIAEHRFISRGRVCVDPGWQAAEPPSKKQQKDQERRLPGVREGQSVHTAHAEVKEGKTEPPKRYSEARLLAAMERAGRELDDEALRRALKDAGLGTPATRAATIETLLKRGYIRRQGKVLQPTPSGRALIAAIPIDDLLSAELTGAWEHKLSLVARGRHERAGFMSDIRAFVVKLVEAMASAEVPDLDESVSEAQVLGHCPLCRGEVTEGFKTYQCATGKSCSFVIFKKIAGRTISPALVQVLLGRGRSQVLRGFRSKRGKRFSATLVLGDDGKVSMEFGTGGSASGAGKSRGDRTSGKSRSRQSNGTSSRSRSNGDGGAGPGKPPRCPACREGRIIAGNRGWGCSRWRESCRFVVWFDHNGVRVPDDEAERLFRRGQTRLMDGLSPDGRARLVLDLEREGNVRIELGKRGRRRGP